MRKIWIWVITLGVLTLVVVVLSFFYQKELVEFFTRLGWNKLAGFVSGPWWTNSIPALILGWGVGVAIWQIIEARKSTNAQIAMDLFRELRDKKTMAEIRKIYDLPDNYSEPKDEYQKGIIEYLISRLNVLGVLVEKGLIDKELAPNAYAGTTSLRCWYKLHKYIWKERCKRKYFGEYFEDYTNRCCQHFEDNNIEVGFNTIDDLVKKLLNAKKEQDKSKKRLYPRSMSEIKRARKRKDKEI